MAGRDPEMGQRDDVRRFCVSRRRHVAHDAALVTGIEHALDEEHAVAPDLQPALAKESGELAGLGGRDRQMFLHPVHQAVDDAKIVDHLRTPLTDAC